MLVQPNVKNIRSWSTAKNAQKHVVNALFNVKQWQVHNKKLPQGH